MSFHAFASAVQHIEPRINLTLGSGLGDIPYHLRILESVSFADLPGVASAGIRGHAGQLDLGWCGTVPILVCRGRLHYYEGHSWEMVGRLMETIAQMGIELTILTNAAGGIHPELQPGSLMVIRDVLDWQHPRGWASPASVGWDRPFIEAVREVSPLVEGTYCAVTGPCYETPAEIRAMRSAGADAVGMSTAWEAACALRLGMRVAGLSCVTNRAAGLSDGVLDHADVLAVAGSAAGRMSDLLEAVLPRLRTRTRPLA